MKVVPVSLLALGMDGLKRATARDALTDHDAAVMTNVRYMRGKIESSSGISTFMAGTVSGRPKVIVGWRHDDGVTRLCVVTHTKAYKVESGAFVDITRVAGDYTGATTTFVDSTLFGSTLIFTNGADAIQKWDGTAANCVALGGTPPNCTTLATAYTFLLLGGISGYPRRVQWSDSGNAELYTGNDSGYFTLYQGPGDVLRIIPLGDVVIAYRESNIHLLYYVGPPYIWGQKQIVTSHGLIASRAVGDLGERHIYWGTDNIYLFDGATRVPVGNDVIDDMNASFEPQYREQIHVGIDYYNRLCKFFYPAIGDGGLCKKAWVFNWSKGTWHHESFVPYDVTASTTHIRTSTLTWATVTGLWKDHMDQSWRQVLSKQLGRKILLVAGTAGSLDFFDEANDSILGAGREKVIESGLINPGAYILQLFGTTRGNKWTLNHVDVEFERSNPTVLEIWVGTQDELLGESDIVWQKYEKPLDGGGKKIDTRRTAQYFTFRIRNTQTGQPFRGNGITAFFTQKGKRST